MPTAAALRFAQHVVDRLAAWAPVQARPMFGGFGVFRDGRMFGLIADETLYLKTDAETAARFDAAGLPPFQYTARGRTLVMSYRQAPAEVFDDASAMVEWAALAWGSALRAGTPPARRRPAAPILAARRARSPRA